jgi:hypothetical protein
MNGMNLLAYLDFPLWQFLSCSLTAICESNGFPHLLQRSWSDMCFAPFEASLIAAMPRLELG